MTSSGLGEDHHLARTAETLALLGLRAFLRARSVGAPDGTEGAVGAGTGAVRTAVLSLRRDADNQRRARSRRGEVLGGEGSPVLLPRATPWAKRAKSLRGPASGQHGALERQAGPRGEAGGACGLAVLGGPPRVESRTSRLPLASWRSALSLSL